MFPFLIQPFHSICIFCCCSLLHLNMPVAGLSWHTWSTHHPRIYIYYFQPPFSGLASRFFDVGFLHSHSPLFKLCNILILNCFLPIKCILQFANCTCTPSHLLCTRQCILCWTPLTECYDSTIIFHRFFCFRKNIYMRMCESMCVYVFYENMRQNSSQKFIANNNNSSFLMQQKPFWYCYWNFQLKAICYRENFIYI